MRIIKFRAWDKEDKEMITWEGLINAYDLHNILKFRNPRFKIMQFTGLKDKNGKEIYEGDILRFVYSKGRAWYDRIVLIENEEGCYGYNFNWKTIKEVHLKCKTKEDNKKLLKLFDRFDEKVIIGNIYENPELLSSKHSKENVE